MSLGQNSSSNTSGAMPAAKSDSPELAQQPAKLGAVSPEPTAPSADGPVADPGSDAEPSPPPKRPEPKLCGVCGTQPGKYKCPRCALPYCSVACNKQHKENHPPDPKPAPATDTDNIPNNHMQQDEPEDPYSILLDNRAAFHRLFAKYPSLPAALERIQETTLPPPPPSNPVITTAAFLPGRQQQRQQQPWTRESGLRRGAEALRRARTDPGEVGDGVREFCDLVRVLLASSKKRKGMGENGVFEGEGEGEAARLVVGRVRREVVAEEMGVIERLMREEGG